MQGKSLIIRLLVEGMVSEASIEDYNSFAETLYIRYSKDVLRMSYFYLGDLGRAEDVMQATFLRLIVNKPTLEEGKEKAWLLKVALNLCRDIWRSGWVKRVFIGTEKLEMYPDENNSIEDRLEKQALLQAVHSLSPDMKETFLLYYYQNYTIDEIATMLGSTSGTIASRLSRGRKQLKKLLGEGDND